MTLADNTPKKPVKAVAKLTPDKGADKNSQKTLPKNTDKNKQVKKTESSFDFAEFWQNVKDYVTATYNEMKKVTWPDRQALIAYTIVVLVAVLIVTGLEWLLDSLLSLGLDKLFTLV